MHGRCLKSENDVTIAKIVRDNGRCSKNLHTDREKEFYNSDVQKLLKKYDINHYSMYSVMKVSNSSIVEERHVETIYAQWKLQMDRHSAISLLQRAQASNYRYAFR